MRLRPSASEADCSDMVEVLVAAMEGKWDWWSADVCPGLSAEGVPAALSMITPSHRIFLLPFRGGGESDGAAGRTGAAGRVTGRTRAGMSGMVDRTTFDRLMLESVPAAQRFAICLIGDVHAAEDVMQEALLRAHRSWKTFRGQSRFTTWLMRIIINCFRDQLAQAYPERASQPGACGGYPPSSRRESVPPAPERHPAAPAIRSPRRFGSGRDIAIASPVPRAEVESRKMDEKSVRYRAEISCFNGQTVSVFSGRSRTVIADEETVVAQGAVGMNPTVKQVLLGAMLEVTPTIIHGNEQAAVVDVKTQVADWSSAGEVNVPTTQTSSPDRGGNVITGSPTKIDKLNILGQALRTTAQIPMGKPVLPGGMTLEPTTDAPGGGQLYLVVELTRGRWNARLLGKRSGTVAGIERIVASRLDLPSPHREGGGLKISVTALDATKQRCIIRDPRPETTGLGSDPRKAAKESRLTQPASSSTPV
jgi:RNA polymerase sigma-70 factor (ECF subfamily)